MCESGIGETKVKPMCNKRDRGNLGRHWGEVRGPDLDHNVPSDLRMNKPYLIMIR